MLYTEYKVPGHGPSLVMYVSRVSKLNFVFYFASTDDLALSRFFKTVMHTTQLGQDRLVKSFFGLRIL